MRDIAQRQGAVTAQIHVPHLNVGFKIAQVVLGREARADLTVSLLVVDCGDLQIVVAVVVQHGEEAEVTHDLRRHKLADEALILKVAHRKVQRFQPVRSGDIREPVLVFFRRRLTDTLNILEHGEAKGIRVNPAVPRAVIGRLEHHVGMAVEELHHEPLGDFPLVVQVVEDGVVPEGRPAFVHHLRLFLRVEILAHLAHDAQDLTLPRLQQRGVLLHKIEQVFLWLGRIAPRFGDRFFFLTLRQGAPQHVHLALQILFAAFLPGLLLLQGDFLRTFVAVNAVVHQRVTGVEQFFHFVHAVAFFAVGNVFTGEDQVIDDGAGIRPAAEQIVILEKGVMPVAGVRHHQRLHGNGVLFH